jgi:hypothetical protein
MPAADAAQRLGEHPFAFTGLPAAARINEAPHTAARVRQLRRQPDGTDVVLFTSVLTDPNDPTPRLP